MEENCSSNTRIGAVKELFWKNKRTRNLTLLLVLGTVLLAAGVFVWRGTYQPKKIAADYVRAMINSDWEKVYELLEIPEGKWLTAVEFQRVQSAKSGETLADLEVLDSEKEQTDRQLLRKYKVEYTVKGEEKIREMPVVLKKQGTSVWGLFSKWKVSSQDLIHREYYIEAPADCRLILDGQPMKTGKKTAEGTTIQYPAAVFVGEHSLRIGGEGLQTEKIVLDVQTGDEGGYVAKRPKLSQGTMQTLESNVQNFMKQIYRDALSQVGITGEYLSYWYLSREPEEKDETKERARLLYEQMEESLNNTGKYDRIQFERIDFSEYDCKELESYNDEAGSLYTKIQVDYAYSYAYTGTDNKLLGGITREQVEEQGDSSLTAVFCREANDWKITEIQLQSVY